MTHDDEDHWDASNRQNAICWDRLAFLGQATDDGGVSEDDARAVIARVNAGSAPHDVARLIQGLTREALIEAIPPEGQRYRLSPAGYAAREREVAMAGDLLGLPDSSHLASELDRLERLRTDLLSTVSHELRTPLTLIRTSVGLLLDSKPDEEMRQRLLRNIKHSTDRMHALVNDLLDLVRLRHNRADLVMRDIDAGELVESAVALIRPLIDEKQQHLVVDLPRPAPDFPGDVRRLERVLLNLLSNANIFSPSGATITVRARDMDNGNEVGITVADTGPGISADARRHLFEQFYTARTSSSSRNIGVGLGLPIAMGIVQAHGGRIDVDSKIGQGSSFHVILPKVQLDERDRYETPGR